MGVILRRVILYLIVGRFPHNKTSAFQLEKRQGLELFAFSGSVWEKVSSALSHMHCRYMGRSEVKGQGFNNITFLRFCRSARPESSESRDGIAAQQANAGVHMSSQIHSVNGRGSSRNAWSDWSGRRRWFLQTQGQANVKIKKVNDWCNFRNT